MKKCKYGLCLLFAMIFMQTVMAQTYKAGDRVEAFIGNAWKQVTVVKAVTGKPGMYTVKAVIDNRAATLEPVTVNKINLRLVKQLAVSPPQSAAVAAPSTETNLHLGRYELYSGIPTMYIGHIVLLAGGKYKVAFNTDEDNYETGSYVFHPGTDTIEWLTGMFKHNNWGGKLVNHSGTYRIEFNKASYADSN